MREKILQAAKETQKTVRPGAVPLYHEEELAKACEESVPDILAALSILEQQHIADAKFSEGYWKIRV